MIRERFICDQFTFMSICNIHGALWEWVPVDPCLKGLHGQGLIFESATERLKLKNWNKTVTEGR